MSRIKLILVLTLLVLTGSCNVHTFTFGEGPSEGYSKVLKQHNFIGGFISNKTPVINEINDEINDLIQEYINSLNEQELIVLEIAKKHLESSFDISKSIGYLKWLNQNNLE